jgi:hypothetical protein
MKPSMIGACLVLAFAVWRCPHGAETRLAADGSPKTDVIEQAGDYLSPDGSCDATLSIAAMGGFRILTVSKSAKLRLKVQDVTGMAWIGGHTLVYTSSPLYGVPGVYVYSCGSESAKRIVAPRTISRSYPDGEDFFELEGISDLHPVTVYFYYAPTVEKVDFKIFRAPAFLYQVHLDGSDFSKAQLTRK